MTSHYVELPLFAVTAVVIVPMLVLVSAAPTTWTSPLVAITNPPLGYGGYQAQFSVTCDLSTAFVWSQAYSACEAQAADGWALASLPTAQAMTAIRSLISNQHIYIAATDEITDSKWFIAAGRYTNRQFYVGQMSGAACALPLCACTPGFYCPWSSGSPDNAGGNEKYGGIWPNIPNLNDYPGHVVATAEVYCYACERSFCALAADCNATNTLSVNTSKYQRGGEPCGCVCKPGFTGPRCDSPVAVVMAPGGDSLTQVAVVCDSQATQSGPLSGAGRCPSSSSGWDVLRVPTSAASALHAVVNALAPGHKVWVRDGAAVGSPAYIVNATAATSMPSFYWAAASSASRVFCVACERRLCADVTQIGSPSARLSTDRPMGGLYPNCSRTLTVSGNTLTHPTTETITKSESSTASNTASHTANSPSAKDTLSSSAPPSKTPTPTQTLPGATLTAHPTLSAGPSHSVMPLTKTPSIAATLSDAVTLSDKGPTATATAGASTTAAATTSHSISTSPNGASTVSRLNASASPVISATPADLLSPSPAATVSHQHTATSSLMVHPTTTEGATTNPATDPVTTAPTTSTKTSQPALTCPQPASEAQLVVTGTAPPADTAGRTIFHLPASESLSPFASSPLHVLFSLSAWQCTASEFVLSGGPASSRSLPSCELLTSMNAPAPILSAILSCDIAYPSIPSLPDGSEGHLICTGTAPLGCSNISLVVTQWPSHHAAGLAVVITVAVGVAASGVSAILLGDPTTVEMPTCAVLLMSPCGSAATHNAGRIAQYIVSPMHATSPAAAIGAYILTALGVTIAHAAFISLRVMRSPSHKIAGFFQSWWPVAALCWFPSLPFAVAAALYPGMTWAVAASTHGDHRNPAAAAFGCLYLLAVPSAGAFILMRLPPRLFLTDVDDTSPFHRWTFATHDAGMQTTRDSLQFVLRRLLRPVGSFEPFYPGERAVGWVRGLAAGHAGRPVGATTAALCLCVAIVWLATGAPRGTSCAPRLYAACALLVVYAITVALWRPFRVAAVNVLTVVAAAAASLVAVGVYFDGSRATATVEERHASPTMVTAGCVIVAVATVFRAALSLAARILETRAHSTGGGLGVGSHPSGDTLLEGAEMTIRDVRT